MAGYGTLLLVVAQCVLLAAAALAVVVGIIWLVVRGIRAIRRSRWPASHTLRWMKSARRVCRAATMGRGLSDL